MALETYLFRTGSREVERVTLDEEVVRALDDQQLLWVDAVVSVGERPELVRSLDELLGLEGALADRPGDPTTSVRFAESTVSVTVPGLADPNGGPARIVWLHLVAAPNRVVSIHAEPMEHLSEPVSVVESDPRFGRLDAGTFMGLILDGMLDGFFREVERLERLIDDIDGRALRSDDADPTLDELVSIRHRIAYLRRALAPQREVFAALLRPVSDQAQSPVGWPWPGLADRLDRALDATENVREQLLGSFDIVMTAVGQRTNDVVRVLTVVSAILLPSVVIAGAMGMNFPVPFFDDPGNFVIVLGMMALLSVGILLISRLRHWI